MERWDNGCVTLLLSDSEWSETGLEQGRIGDGSGDAEGVLRRLIRQAGLTDTRRVRVEALPMETGMLLLLTPLPTRRVLCIHSRRQPRIFRLTGVDRLLDFIRPLRRETALPPGRLYRVGEDFWFLLYPSGNHRRLWRLLAEYGEPVPGGATAVAWVEEHGCLLEGERALERLAGITANG